MKLLLTLSLMTVLAACSVKPQVLKVDPQLDFQSLNGVKVPIELQVEDKRANTDLLGYLNAKNEGPISFEESLVKSLGVSLQKAMLEQGIDMNRRPEPLSTLKVTIEKLKYSSPNKDWVSRIELEGEIVISINRGPASLTKRFTANRAQDVATSPNQEFNQKYLNALLSELFNKAMNDKEVTGFLK